MRMHKGSYNVTMHKDLLRRKLTGYCVTITTSTNQAAGGAVSGCQRKLRHSSPLPPETVTMATVTIMKSQDKASEEFFPVSLQ